MEWQVAKKAERSTVAIYCEKNPEITSNLMHKRKTKYVHKNNKIRALLMNEYWMYIIFFLHLHNFLYLWEWSTKDEKKIENAAYLGFDIDSTSNDVNADIDVSRFSYMFTRSV